MSWRGDRPHPWALSYPYLKADNTVGYYAPEHAATIYMDGLEFWDTVGEAANGLYDFEFLSCLLLPVMWTMAGVDTRVMPDPVVGTLDAIVQLPPIPV